MNLDSDFLEGSPLVSMIERYSQGGEGIDISVKKLASDLLNKWERMLSGHGGFEDDAEKHDEAFMRLQSKIDVFKKQHQVVPPTISKENKPISEDDEDQYNSSSDEDGSSSDEETKHKLKTPKPTPQ